MERNDTIQIRIATSEKQEICMAAGKAGKTASDWMREVLLEIARGKPELAASIRLREPAKSAEDKPEDPDAAQRLPSGRLMSATDAALLKLKKSGRQQ